MTQDKTFDYTWDGENRLAAAQTRLGLGTNPTGPDANDKRLEFKYDYHGRRVEKSYQVYNGSAWVTQAGYPQRYVYDDWNVVLTLDGSNNNQIVRKSTWGLDLSGGLHGAGESWNYYWYFYDGNGNVTQVIEPPAGSGCSASATVCDWLPQILCGLSGEDGEEETPAGEEGLESASSEDEGMSVMAAGGGGGGGPPAWLLTHYEYDPYGNILYSYGSYANVNPFRFSTKWVDAEPGSGKEQYHYGYRYYSPKLGRWLSRDPIEEAGGIDLYSFVVNAPTVKVDPLGLANICQLGKQSTVGYQQECGVVGLPVWGLYMCGYQKCTDCYTCEYWADPDPKKSQTRWTPKPYKTVCGPCTLRAKNRSAPPACPSPPKANDPQRAATLCATAMANPTLGNCEACCEGMHGTEKAKLDECMKNCKRLPVK